MGDEEEGEEDRGEKEEGEEGMWDLEMDSEPNLSELEFL